MAFFKNTTWNEKIFFFHVDDGAHLFKFQKHNLVLLTLNGHILFLLFYSHTYLC